MHYVSEAIPTLEKLAQAYFSQGDMLDGTRLRFIIKQLREGVKYLLPLHGRVGVRVVTNEVFEMMRCPYPVMVFEFATLDTLIEKEVRKHDTVFGKPASPVGASSKRIALVIDGESDVYKSLHREPFEGVLVIVVSYMDDMNLWTPNPIASLIPRQNNVRNEKIGKHTFTSFDVDTFDLLPALINRSVRQYGPQARRDAIRDLQEEITVTVNALTAVNCRNIGYVALEPSGKLNKKRIKSGKEPYFEYRVLDIFVPDARKLPSGGGQRQRAILDALRKPFALHAVPGHFKRRKTGTFWWRQHYRGDPERGVVVKDYDVKNGENDDT